MGAEAEPFGERIRDATALVVGGDGGIGRGFIDRLSRDPRFAHVVSSHRSASRVPTALDPATRTAVALDVTDEDSVERAIDEVRERHGSLDLVVYAVGVLHGDGLRPEKGLKDVRADALVRSYQVNAVGAALVAKHVAPLLEHERPGVFAAISAKVGSIGDNRLGGWYGYRASKAALNMLVKGVAIECGRRPGGAIVVALHPGTTDTPLSRPFQRGVPPEKLFSVTRTVEQLMAVVDGLDPSDSGRFFGWDGAELPW